MTDHNKIAVLAGGCFWGMEGSVTRDRDPTTPPDWQLLLSGYAPLVLYAAVWVAERVLPRPSNRRAALTG
jgi:hypothetical protein